MIRGLHPVMQGVLGTLFTWFVTALGSAVVFVFPSSMSKEREGAWLDCCLGFSAGVMLAASYWSLLDPAIELASTNGYGVFSFLPAALGFFFGAATVSVADIFLPNPDNVHEFLAAQDVKDGHEERMASEDPARAAQSLGQGQTRIGGSGAAQGGALRQRKKKVDGSHAVLSSRDNVGEANGGEEAKKRSSKSWRRVLLLVIAMTIHNFPEGLAVGVAFGSIGKSPSATFEAATVLAIGIGLQNFPEGLAVSLPMHREKRTKMNSFFWGQMSGAVEPIGGFLGAVAVEYAEWFLPYSLGFAAGAMIYVVVDSIIPEAQERGNGFQASWGAILGFLLMMSMDVAFAD